MRLLDKIDPNTRASAEALGYGPHFELDPIDGDPVKPLPEGTYYWFPAEALTGEPRNAREEDEQHRRGRLRPLPLETRFLWAINLRRAQEMREQADLFASATRGLFRLKLREMGFYDPDDVEFALRAFLKGKRVDVERRINAPSRLIVDGKLVAENVIARHLRLTALADETI